VPGVLETARAFGEIVGPMLAGGGIWSYLKARTLARSKAPAAIASSNADLVSALTQQTKTLLAENAKDRRQLRIRINGQGQDIKKLSAEIAQCNQKHHDCENNLADVRARIDRLMGEPVPPYTLGTRDHAAD
jgi:septal ring factor EnvC (AmiA/AmiB activator)